jgi:hypothetical protein
MRTKAKQQRTWRANMRSTRQDIFFSSFAIIFLLVHRLTLPRAIRIQSTDDIVFPEDTFNIILLSTPNLPRRPQTTVFHAFVIPPRALHSCPTFTLDFYFLNSNWWILVLMPACQSALQPWVSLGPLYNQSLPGVRFLNKIIFYRMGFLAPCPTPILEDQGVSLSLDSTLWFYRHGWPCW